MLQLPLPLNFLRGLGPEFMLSTLWATRLLPQVVGAVANFRRVINRHRLCPNIAAPQWSFDELTVLAST